MPSTARSWPGWSRGSVSRYLAAILAVAVAILARYLLQPVLGDRYPFVTLYATVLIVSTTFGFGPGLLTSIVGAAIASVLFVPAPGAILEGGREAYGQVIR